MIVDVHLVDTYRDGGTKRFKSINGSFFFTSPHYKGVYDRFPSDEDARQLDVELNVLPGKVDTLVSVPREKFLVEPHYKELYKKALEKLSVMSDDELIAFVYN